MPFATFSDVQERMQRALTSAEQATATAAIAEAEDVIVRYTGQKIYEGEATLRAVSTTGAVLVPQRPLLAVTGYRLIYDNVPETQVIADTLTVIGNAIYGLPIGVLFEIDYSYGYSQVPLSLKGMVVRSALRALANPTGAVQLQVGGWRAQYDTAEEAAAVLFGVSDLDVLKRFREPRAGTVYLTP